MGGGGGLLDCSFCVVRHHALSNVWLRWRLRPDPCVKNMGGPSLLARCALRSRSTCNSRAGGAVGGKVARRLRHQRRPRCEAVGPPWRTRWASFRGQFWGQITDQKMVPFSNQKLSTRGCQNEILCRASYEKNPFAGPSGFRPWGQNLVRFPTPEIGPLFGPAFSVLWAPLAQGAVAEGGGRSAFGRCPFAIGRSHFLAGLP